MQVVKPLPEAPGVYGPSLRAATLELVQSFWTLAFRKMIST